MRVQTEEWRRFIPGVRMYKGKKTLFYNGENLSWDDESDEYLVYNKEERRSWQVIIVLPGVEIIPDHTFKYCFNVDTVIMADTVKRIEIAAFRHCWSLVFVKLSRNLEYIGVEAFDSCSSLTSIFIPPSCREIGREAFGWCKKLIIFHVPRHTLIGTGRKAIRHTTMIGINAIRDTALFDVSPFESDSRGYYEKRNRKRVNKWVKEINEGDEYELHQACSSFNPLTEIIYGIVKRKGLNSWKMKNELGLTPFDYLEANPFADIKIDQRELMKRYVLEM